MLGGPDAVGERFVQPTILVDVPEDSAAVQEETFGPTMTVTRVRDMDEAVAQTNATRYGLGSTVFAKAHGMEIAERIRSGMTAVNGVITFAGDPVSCRSAASATPASAGSTGPTGSGSSATRTRSHGSGSSR